MKKFLICILFAFFALIITSAKGFCAAHPVKTVLVITDTGHRNGTNYLICGAASDIIAADIINRINMTGRMKAPLLGDTMSKITGQSIPLYYVTFFNEYKYNYNVDFVNLKRVTRNIPADYILMVTSGLDVQSNFLKDTWWNKLNVPGMDPVKPTYKLSTLITLIDKRTYRIMWQDLYLRDIEAHNYDLGLVQFSPSYAQLSKIKKYSKNMSEYVTNIIDRQVNPWIVPPQEPKAVEMKSRFLNEGTKLYYPTVNGEVVKQNLNDFKDDTHKKLNDAHTKWNNYQRQRMQKKHIENVRRIEKKQQIQKQKQEVQKQTVQPKRKKDERLFESIRDNIDDVSNTLPPVQEVEEDKNIKPAVDIVPKKETETNAKPAAQKEEAKLVKPVMNKPAQQTETKPAVNRTSKPAVQKPQVEQAAPQEVPRYDWNLKNIYLEKIGRLSRLE